MADVVVLERLVRSIVGRLDKLESEIIAPLAASVELLSKRVDGGQQDEEQPGVPGHRPWRCEGCRALLGIYDEKRDVLRIRVKDYHVQVSPGAGGWVEIGCRRCGHPNRVSHSPGGG